MLPRTVTNVEPKSGPLHGCTSITRTVTRRKDTPSLLNSRPLLLTSTETSPALERVELHTTAFSLNHRARRTTPPMRHSNRPKDSAAPWKALPCTVSGVPPSASAMLGDTKLTDNDSRNVYSTPESLYCCAFIDSISAFVPSDCNGVTHSSWFAST